MVHKLLKSFPTDFGVPIHPAIKRQYTMASLIVYVVGGIWGMWLINIPFSRFPISWAEPYMENYAMPDFGTGQYYTLVRQKDWEIDLI